MGHEHTEGNKTEKKHRSGLLHGKNVNLAIRKDIKLEGFHLNATQNMAGYVKGNVYAKDVQDTVQGDQVTQGGSVGLALGPYF